MNHGRAASILLLAVTTGLVGGCGGNGPGERAAPSESASATASTDAEAFCDAARRIAELDDESQAAINNLMVSVSTQESAEATEAEFERGMADFRDYADEQFPELVQAYDELEAQAPAHLKEDAATVRDFSTEFMDMIRGFETADDWGRLEHELQDLGAIEAGQATLRLDKFSRDECGVTLAD